MPWTAATPTATSQPSQRLQAAAPAADRVTRRSPAASAGPSVGRNPVQMTFGVSAAPPDRPCLYDCADLMARLAALALLLVLTIVVAACGGGDGDRGSVPAVDLALDFTPNAVHAPIYAAVRRGFDRANGINLRIRQPGEGPDSLKLVASGRVAVGVLDIGDLAIARRRGADVVAVGELVNRP